MSNLVLVTGATGRLGPHVVEQLKSEGYNLRIATPDAVESDSRIEWIETDFLKEVDYDRLVAGCGAVVHLAAELSAMDKMQQVNVEATRQLAAASERAGIEVFVYTSSVGVYGFPKEHVIFETTPTLDVKSSEGFLAAKYLYDYCVTKLWGEDAIRESAKRTRYVIGRPSNIVTEKQIEGVLEWGWKTRLWRAHRNTHQIYVKDVAAALVYLMKWALREGAVNPGGIATFNLSNDDVADNTYGKLLSRYSKALGRFDFCSMVRVPGFVDVVKDALKYRHFSGRLPAGLAIYSPAKLLMTGFRHPYGILNIQDQVIARMAAAKSSQNR